eukprot:Ihof_evm1s987 gene=Ihof_evmTU1s987
MDIEEEDGWTANPFADPAIWQATSESTATTVPAAAKPVNGPATLSSVHNPGTSTTETPTSTTVSGLPGTDLSEREAEIARKEEQLQRQQAELDQRERELARRGQGSGYRPPNWPNFPAWLPPPFRPIIYHSIPDDIPVDNQVNMNRMFALWHYLCLCYLLNLIAAISGTACSTCTSTGANVGIAVVLFVLGIPSSFKLWYFMLYTGIRKDRSVNFMIFFFIFGFQILTAIYLCLGIPGTGACGWVGAVQAVKVNGAIGFFYFVSAIAWTLLIGACVFMIIE